MKTNQIIQALVISTFILFSLISATLQAQHDFKKTSSGSNFYIQPNAGISQYYGDLNEKKYWNQHPELALGAVLSYQLTPIFGLRGQFLKTNLYSERADQNIVFNSNLWDGALNLTINLNEVLAKLITNNNDKAFLNFYIFSGVGISSFKSKISDMETGEILNEHTVRQYEFFLPIGAGVAFRLNRALSLNLEYGDHSIFGGTKLDFTDNSKQNNDHYSYVSAGLQIRIGNKDTDNDGVKDKADQCPGLYGKVELAGCPDNDNDGIADKEDACPDIAGGIEFNGCPDKDGDGIIDREDDCPDVPGKLYLNGCPDRDDDGITDNNDKCPDEPGRKELAGCPDQDGDGVPDYDDKCPDVNGKKELAGCPDSDGDGIIDSKDSCMYAAGKIELAGCPDQDGDGIADKDDICPEIRGLTIFSGCPDTDYDGIPDIKDKCPKVPGVAANSGCPEIVKKPVVYLQRKVTFGSGSFEVFPSFKNMLCLDEIVAYIQENPEAIISVAGFADITEENDLQLSEKRADYVINYLKKKSNISFKIEKSFLGKSKPVANNKTEEGRALNRRVEIKITK